MEIRTSTSTSRCRSAPVDIDVDGDDIKVKYWYACGGTELLGSALSSRVYHHDWAPMCSSAQIKQRSAKCIKQRKRATRRVADLIVMHCTRVDNCFANARVQRAAGLQVFGAELESASYASYLITSRTS